MVTVKANQPTLHHLLKAPTWADVPSVTGAATTVTAGGGDPHRQSVPPP